MIRQFSLIFLVLLSSTAWAGKPSLSLVIDDLGYSFEQAKKVLSLPGNHTFAIIPETTYSKKIAQFAHQNGHEVMLHMPMQSSTDLIIESTALNDQMSEQEITDSVVNMMKDVPYIKGINNHMGSRLTELGYIMRPVMETIKQQNQSLYFLDSRTTALSKAYQQALMAGVPTLKRDVFLDADRNNLDSIRQQFDRWLELARENGHAVAIAHPYKNTIDVLLEKMEEMGDEFEFVTISQQIANLQQEEAEWPRYLSQLQMDSKSSKQ
jgi:uncharacterized protein